jgi:hypothetical protein
VRRNYGLAAFLAVAALGGLGGQMWTPARDAPPIPSVAPKQHFTRRQALRGAGGGIVREGYVRRPRRTVAQDKRDATKARNRARHKRACR